LSKDLFLLAEPVSDIFNNPTAASAISVLLFLAKATATAASQASSNC
jgi:hypothetical protein